MDIKNEVLYRVYFLLFGVVIPVACALVYQTAEIAYVQGEQWREQGKEWYIEPRPVQAERGNILAENNSLLATSIPYFDIYMDPNSTGMTDTVFYQNIDTLGHCLAMYVNSELTAGGWVEYLKQQREAGKRYVEIKRKATFAEKDFISQFPLFKLGQMRGGLIVEQHSERRRPFGILAQRTIGYVERTGAKPVGLEASFNTWLGGKPGKQLMFQVDKVRDIWIPVDSLALIEPKSGSDVITTINVNMQDLTEEALLRAMNYHDAEWGTAVVMEVATGKIKAIANLGRTDEGWWETFNYAVGQAIEPGSTFKLASMMAMLEDGYIELNDTVNIERGRTQFFDDVLEDSAPESRNLDSTTVQHVFEISSNVGMAKLVNQYYGKKERINRNQGAERFIQRLKDFNLHLPTGIELDGEANPFIKEAYNAEDQWSGTTLPWMAIGYELRLTPLQILTFYNAVANNGALVKPYLVSELQSYGKTERRFQTTVLKRQIASDRTIQLAHTLLEAVVDTGTARKLKTDAYDFAGKTGTAQVGYRRTDSGTTLIRGYQSSFVGYFPAKQPKYSCIVVVNKPRRGGFYGADVAGPVFREIADRIFATNLELQMPLNAQVKTPLKAGMLPTYDSGYRQDMETVLDYLNIDYYRGGTSEIAILQGRSDSLVVLNRTVAPEKVVPNVTGMGLRDAVYLMENRGLRVQVQGFGKVVRQSILPGTRAHGQHVKLFLN
jgi:cell division protein FtsI (penicillin-binding protein 3)